MADRLNGSRLRMNSSFGVLSAIEVYLHSENSPSARPFFETAFISRLGMIASVSTLILKKGAAIPEIIYTGFMFHSPSDVRLLFHL